MKRSHELLDPRLEEKLELILAVPTRDPQVASRRRANFLKEVKTLSQPITGSQNRRLNRWIDPIITFLGRKERSPMFAPLVSILVVLSLLAGGGTVIAAQDSLPGQALYEVKLASEDMRLTLANDTEAKINLNLAFATRRVDELKTLLDSDLVPPDALLARLQTELDGSMALAAGLEDDRMEPILDRVRQALQNQIRALQGTGIDSQATQQARLEQILLALTRVREMLQERLTWVNIGLSDPQAFRQQWRHRQEFGPGQWTGEPGEFGPGPQTNPTEIKGAGPGPLATCTCTPGSSYGPGPFVTGTPAPGSGFGPGPGKAITATPETDSGAGPGEGSGYGPGPGPAPNSTCTPQSGPGGNGPGPQATQPDANTTVEPQTTSNPGGSAGSGPGPAPSSTCTPQSGPGGNEGGDGSGGGGNGGGGKP